MPDFAVTVDVTNVPVLYDALDEVLGAVVRGLIREGGGSLVLAHNDGEWTAAAVFGQEAEDSDMAGGAAYGLETSIEDALGVVAREMGVM